MKEQNLEEGFYSLKSDSEEEPVIVYGYHCTDMSGEFGFGFNIHDGGGFLPLYDISDGTKITRVHFEKSD